MTNKTLRAAREARNDEFYTQKEDIQAELRHYKPHFKGKVVYCNCDDPWVSGFFHYFSHQFETLGLKRLIATCYQNDDMNLFSSHDKKKRGVALQYDGKRDAGGGVPNPEDAGVTILKGDGDFRSPECVELLKQADIVVTNPPFSLFRPYVAQLIKFKKKFLIIGNKNAVKYKEIFPLIKENKMWPGYSPMGVDMLFDVPKTFARKLVATKKEGSAYKIVGGVVKGRASAIWLTNMDHKKRHKKLHLVKRYNAKDYPKYDNYDAINVTKISDIPADYPGAMGVPITFLDKYNPDQFEMIGIDRVLIQQLTGKVNCFFLNGKELYSRILIRNKEL